MENLFTRGEIITFKIIGWAITLLTGLASSFISIWLFYKNKKETKKLEKELKEEIIARKDSEKKTAEENAKRWNTLYRYEKELKEKHCEWVGEREKEVVDLRKQLTREGIPPDEHDISDIRRRKNSITRIKNYWKSKQNKSGKINKRTIDEVLGGENWENVFKNKEGEEIIELRNWLIKKIDDELELAKK